ncbi:hypothetical protein XBP1_1340005 [Xenorhabdus bovienii str. puntauvense]|uniref:Uncharacterized protein n=3 Tax=Xenorhabdus bovienii TaxID=40576 RepID=A0A077NBW0_XENBV|nr:hypothetical protein XBP1_1340005 [Xenorhabdus bovienii str. puntauvense]CDH00112.1 hypothetical protein XBFM1_1310092 [Xenorhabdus bovienii str. feltiae Moldova]CDH24630.1 hypothetical protein XBKB1_300005 [Xenorhabdus bovienii str. kraussei Becker Underwood]
MISFLLINFIWLSFMGVTLIVIGILFVNKQYYKLNLYFKMLMIFWE